MIGFRCFIDDLEKDISHKKNVIISFIRNLKEKSNIFNLDNNNLLSLENILKKIKVSNIYNFKNELFF